MEQSQYDAEILDATAHHLANSIYEGVEYHEHPCHTEEVEEHVGKCCTPSLGGGRKGGYVRCNGGTYVLAHYQRYALIDRQCATGT